MYRYRIQKQVLPLGAAADLHHLSGTFELLSRFLAPFLHCPFISSFSSQLLVTSVAPVQFFLSLVKVTQLKTFLFTSVELPFHWIMVSTVFCVIIFVSCTAIKPTGVLPLYYKARPSTTLHDKTCTKHVPTLPCSTKLAQSTFQWYFVLQNLHKALSRSTLYYKACTKYFPLLLCTTRSLSSAERGHGHSIAIRAKRLHKLQLFAAPKAGSRRQSGKTTILKHFLK